MLHAQGRHRLCGPRPQEEVRDQVGPRARTPANHDSHWLVEERHDHSREE